MKKILTGAVLAFVLIIPAFSFAQTAPLSGQFTGAETQSDCVDLQYNLSYRSRDVRTNDEVSLLQDFLLSQGYLSGESTGYLGKTTRGAVKNFQEATGLHSAGFVGPRTRAKIKEISCGRELATRTITRIASKAQAPASASVVMTNLAPLLGGHVKYFGFYNNNLEITKTLELTKIPYINIVSIGTVNTETGILAVTASGKKTIVNIQDIFFEKSPNPDSKRTFPQNPDLQLRLDYKSRWQAFVDLNNLTQYVQGIATFFLVDEPYWNNLTYDELQTASSFIKQSFPSVPVSMAEAFTVLDSMNGSSLRVPPTIDWVGFDKYGVVHPATDTAIRANLNTLKAALTSPNQRIIFIGDTWWAAGLHDQSGLSPADMANVFKEQVELVNSEPLVVAMINFSWDAPWDYPNALGAPYLPQTVLDLYVSTGSTFQSGVRAVAPTTAAITLSPTSVATTGTFTASWSGNNSPAGYNVKVNSTTYSQSSATIWTGTPTSLGLAAGTHYFYVQACNAIGCSPWSSVATLIVTTPSTTSATTTDIPYKKDLKLDVYRSTTSNAPTLVFVHGGGWFSGNKTIGIKDFIEDLVSRGNNVVSIDYTLVPQGHYPAPLLDIDCALRWVNANAKTFGLDTNRISIGGSSAGAHLALLYSLNSKAYADESCFSVGPLPPIKKVVSLAGITDLTIRIASNLQPMIDNFLLTPSAYAEASPITYANANNGKQYLLVHAQNDAVVNFADNMVPFYDALMKWTSGTVQKRWYVNGEHDLIGLRGSANYLDTINTISAFLSGLYTEPPTASAPTATWSPTSVSYLYGGTIPYISYSSTNATSCSIYNSANGALIESGLSTSNSWTAGTFASPWNITSWGRKLVCFNAVGIASSPSYFTATVIPITAPTTATITISPTSVATTGTFTASWSGNNSPTSYKIKVGTTIYDMTSTSWSGTPAALGLATGSHSFSAQACNAIGCGAWSTVVTLTVMDF